MFTRSSAPERLVDGVKGLISDAEELLDTLAADVEEPVKSLRSRLEKSLRNTKKRVTEGGRLVADASQEALNAADRYTHANPWKIITIATSIGFVIGMVTGRTGASRRSGQGYAAGRCGQRPRGAGTGRTE